MVFFASRNRRAGGPLDGASQTAYCSAMPNALTALYPWPEYFRPWKLFTLAAGIALVIGALNMKSDRVAGSEVWAHADIIKASRHAMYSVSEHPFVR